MRQAAVHLRTGAFTTALRPSSGVRGLLDAFRANRWPVVPRCVSTSSPPWYGWSRNGRRRPVSGRCGSWTAPARPGSMSPWSALSSPSTSSTCSRASRSRRAAPRSPPDLHRARSALAGGQVRRNLGALAYYAGQWTEAAALVRHQSGRRGRGRQCVRGRRDRRQPRRAADQPGPPRGGRGDARRRASGAACLGRCPVPRGGSAAARPRPPQPREPRRGRGAGRSREQSFTELGQPDERPRGGPRARRGRGTARAGRRSRST